MRKITAIEPKLVQEYEQNAKNENGTLAPTKLGMEYHDGKMQMVMDCSPMEAATLLGNLVAELVKQGSDYTEATGNCVVEMSKTIVEASLPTELQQLLKDLNGGDEQ